MSTYYENIILQIAPYKEKVFYLPLTQRQLTDLENNMGHQFPDYFQQFLLTFGIQQDLIFGLIETEETYVAQYNYLPDSYKNSFVPIADNGGEDNWLLNTVNPKDKMVYEWQHWLDGEIVPLGFTFDELIQKNIESLKNEFESKAFNSEKTWRVQFPVFTSDEPLLLETIGAVRLKDWVKTEVSPADVHVYETEINLLSKTITLGRQEYKSWQHPLYYFNWNESLGDIGHNSIIRMLDEALESAFPNYGKVDYGILAV